MKPLWFEEVNKTLLKPGGWTDEECGPLSVFTDGKLCVSLWELTEEEKQEILTHGRIWLFVYSGATQPPVAMTTKEEIFEKK